MTWQGDRRTSTPFWRRLRQLVLESDGYICHVCGEPGADEVDHLRSHADCVRLGLDPDDPANLAAIHDDPCHRRKSASEGHAAKARMREARTRPVRPHPGIRPPPA